ncbi:MAG: penicillin-binding protein 2 [Candidatus Sungbacteria bacterium]|nr:penicillin-binding protein 2 [Candidatus Sungbacteria bacterium]
MFKRFFGKLRPGGGLSARSLIEPEEIFMDAVNLPGHDRVRGEGRIEHPLPLRVFIVWAIAVFLGFSLVVGRLVELQIVRGKELNAASQKNISYTLFSAPPRGLIYDRNGRIIASNATSFFLILRRREVADEEVFRKTIENVSALLGRSAEELWFESVLKEGSTEDLPHDFFAPEAWPDEVVLVQDVSRSVLLRIATNQMDFRGLSIEETVLREYPLGYAASHVIGFTSFADSPGVRLAGKSGTELVYEDMLRGEPGKKIIEINAEGDALRERFITAASPGSSVVLNIDVELQRAVYEIMARAIPSAGKRAGAAVVSDPRDGRIIALASFPAFDPEVISRGKNREAIKGFLTNKDKPFFDRTISGTYPPGSTVKPLLAAGALDEKIIDAGLAIYDEGFIAVPNPYDSEKESIFKDWSKLGWVDLRRAIAFSANVYFYTIGGGYGDITGLGIERIRKILFAFGFGSRLGIDLPGEKAGLVPGPEEKKGIRPDDPFWRLGDTYITSIGQGDMGATPLQVNFATAAIANGGTLFRPFVTKSLLDENGSVVKEISPHIIRGQIASSDSLGIVREGMRLAVTEGSAAALADFPLAVAGKTGTAQTGVSGKNHGWFTAFAPYQDPEVVVTILVEEGTGGSTDALPIAKEILWAWLAVRNNQTASNAQ